MLGGFLALLFLEKNSDANFVSAGVEGITN